VQRTHSGEKQQDHVQKNRESAAVSNKKRTEAAEAAQSKLSR
jgi:hypothetical protein